MGRQVLWVSAAMMTAVLLALGVGRALPRGEQLLFSSSDNWRASAWNIYMVDIGRRVSQRLFTTRADTLPGLPVVWSPNGGEIAFLFEDDSLQTFLVDPQGKNLRRLTSDATDKEYNAAWSPDGRYLAFIGEREGVRDVYLASGDGTAPRNLTGGRISFRSLVWSPDSRHLALEALSRGDIDLYLLDIETAILTNLTHQRGNDIRPSWSPDGERIAFLSSRNSAGFGNTRYDLYMMTRTGANVRRFTNNVLADSSWQADWSPDGERLVYGSWSWAGGADIFVVDVRHGLTRNVTRDNARDGTPVWSPDGTQIAFESRRSGMWQIELVSADGWRRRTFTGGSVESRRPSWSPDGMQIVYIANPARNWDLYMADLNGSISQRITRTRSIDYLPVWRPVGG
jgi:Tol biopolymer transport system component